LAKSKKYFIFANN